MLSKVRKISFVLLPSLIGSKLVKETNYDWFEKLRRLLTNQMCKQS